MATSVQAAFSNIELFKQVREHYGNEEPAQLEFFKNTLSAWQNICYNAIY